MVQIKKLSNGIRVVMEQLPYFRTAALGIWVHVGSVNETKEDNGISHMIEHMFFKGTKTKTAKELADTIAGIGDDVNAFTSKEYTSFYGTTTTEHLPVLVDLLGDMLMNSIFDENDLQKEKKVILEEIDMYEDSPEDLVHELLQQAVWESNSLGFIISGNKSNVKKFKREQLLAFIDKHYIPEKMVISLAGNFDPSTVFEQVEKVFGTIKQKKDRVCFRLSGDEKQEVPYLKFHRSFCLKQKEIEQLYMNMAFPAIPLNSSERFSFSVMNSIFGGSNNSRLFQQIREELSLAYSVYSYSSEFERAGLFHIDVIVSPLQAEKTLTVIDQILCEITKHGISDEELALHKEQLKIELIMGSESAKSKMNSNAKSIFLRNRVLPLDEVLDCINSVTLNGVNDVIYKYLKMRESSLSLVGQVKDVDVKTVKRWWKQYSDIKIDNGFEV